MKHIEKYSKKLRVSENHTRSLFGRYGVIEDDNDGELYVKVVNGINEWKFYYLYCCIRNVTAKHQLALTQMLVLSAIMAKPLDFNLPVDSKDGKLTEIAEFLSTDDNVKTKNSIYQSVKRLRDSGYLKKTEDNLIVLDESLQHVRYNVKNQLEKKGFATFDHLFKCVIVNDKEKLKEDE